MTRQARVLWTSYRCGHNRRSDVAVHAQAPQRSGSSAAAKPARTAAPYVPAKTPWGDPDLQGTYTNKDENGIPMERPGQFAGKSVDDVDDSEFAGDPPRASAACAGQRRGDWRCRHRRRTGALVRALQREEQPRLAHHRSGRRPYPAADRGRAEGGGRACDGTQELVAADPPTPGRTAASTTAASRAACRAR